MAGQPPSPAELSSLSTSIDEIVRRVHQMADEAAPAPDDPEADRTRSVAADLWEIERALRSAQRRLESLSR